jgi:hypothetical protein
MSTRDFTIEYYEVCKRLGPTGKRTVVINSTDPESAVIELGHRESMTRHTWDVLVAFVEAWTICTMRTSPKN